MSDVLHIGLCDGRHPIKQNDSLFNIDGSYTRGDNPTAGEPMDLFVFPSEVDEPLNFDGHRALVYELLSGKHPDELSYADEGAGIEFAREGGLEKMEDLERVYLYVTGLSSLLTSFLWVWIHNDYLWNKVPLVLMHYDRDTGEYKEEYWG